MFTVLLDNKLVLAPIDENIQVCVAWGNVSIYVSDAFC